MCIFSMLTVHSLKMEQIKKKLAALKEERDAALEKADEAEANARVYQDKAEAVSAYTPMYLYQSYECRSVFLLLFAHALKA